MREPERIIEMIAKLLNHLPSNHMSRIALHESMKQFQGRKFELQTFFLKINWNILLGVIKI